MELVDEYISPLTLLIVIKYNRQKVVSVVYRNLDFTTAMYLDVNRGDCSNATF